MGSIRFDEKDAHMHVLALQPARPSPGSWVVVKYSGEGWHMGKLSSDMKTVTINGEAFEFDATEDEFVDYSIHAKNFIALHPDSVMVRLNDIEYILSNPKISLDWAIRSINAVRNRSNQKLLPPIESEYKSYTIEQAAALCSPAILVLEVL